MILIKSIDGPLLSIVIPTRNRQMYAIHAIRSILSIQSENLELVVQDNSDDRSLESMIKFDILDTRLLYNYTPPPLSSIDNFNHGMRLATGEFVCFIGDDDSVNPNIVIVTAWAKANGIDAVRGSMSAYYFWPDVVQHRSLESRAGTLFIANFTSKITFADINQALISLVENGGQGYLEFDLPKVYHGIIRRDILERIRQVTGKYFDGLSPDIFSSIMVSQYINQLACIDYPLTLNGSAVLSTASDSSAGKHKGSLEKAPHLRNRSDYLWDQMVPKFYSPQTIWAESAIVALKKSGHTELLKLFNVSRLCAYCTVLHPDYAGFILSEMYRIFKDTNRNPIIGSIQFVFNIITYLAWRIFNYLKRRIQNFLYKKVYAISNIDNSEKATNALTTCLQELGDPLISTLSTISMPPD